MSTLDRGIMRLGGIVQAGESALGASMRTSAPALVTGADQAAVGTASTATDAARSGADALIPPMDGFFDRPASSLARADWDQLAAALAADPHGAIIPGPRSVFEGPDLRLVVDQIRLGHEESILHAERYFGAIRATAAGPEVMLAQARAALGRRPADLSTDEWRALSNVVDADPDGLITHVPPMARREHAGLRQSIFDHAWGRPSYSENTDHQFRRWVRAHDPAYPAKLQDAVDAALAGKWTSDQFMTLRIEADGFEDLVTTLPDLTAKQRRQVAWVVSGQRADLTAGWVKRHDPEYDQLLRAAVETVEPETTNKLQWWMLRADSDRLVELVADRPLEQRQVILKRALRDTDFHEWRREHDPTFAQSIEEAIDLVSTGGYQWEAKSLLQNEGVDRMAPIVARHPFEQQERYQQAMLRPDDFIPWLRANAPDWEARVAASIDEAVTSTPSERAASILRAEAGRIDEFVAGRPYVEQDRIARHVLDLDAYREWDKTNNPEHRAKVAAAIDRVVRGEDELDGDFSLLYHEQSRIDQHTAGHDYGMQVRIARAVLGKQSTTFSEWMAKHDPNRPETLRAAADAMAAGTHSPDQYGALANLKEQLPTILEGRSVADRLRIIRTLDRSTFTNVVDGWHASFEPELRAARLAAAGDARHGELSEEARVVLAGATYQLDELTAGADYETQLRIADAVLGNPHYPKTLQEWKVGADPDRVARITASVAAIADGNGTAHDHRVLFGEKDVLGLVRGRPYDEQLRVAEIALGDSIGMWTRANDPEYQLQVIAAIDGAISGNLTKAFADLLDWDRASVFRHLSNRTPQEQTTVAAAMLGRAGSSFEGIQAAMRDMALEASARLQALPEVAATNDLRESTRVMLDLNIKRMSGLDVGDPNRGYGLHPDYAEMGRVQTNLDLLEAVARGTATTANAADIIAW